jgi:hypothetical protein
MRHQQSIATGRLGQFRILHCQQFEWRLEGWQLHHSPCPFGDVRPAVQVEGANLRKRNVAVAEQVGNGGLCSTEIVALSEMRVQYRERCVGAPMMIVCYRRFHPDRQQAFLSEPNPVAVKDRWNQNVLASNVAASDLARTGGRPVINGVAGMAMSAGSGGDAHASASRDSYDNPAASSPPINLHCAAF